MLENFEEALDLKVVHKGIGIASDLEAVCRYKLSLLNDEFECEIIEVMAFLGGRELESPLSDI